MRTFVEGPWQLPAKLILGIDIGTTHSTVSFAYLYPSGPQSLHGTRCWPGYEHRQDEIKIPTVVWYDRNGKAMSCGAEAAKSTTLDAAADQHWRLTRHFKLHLYPKEMLQKYNIKVTPLPTGISLEKVYADFMVYLMRHTRAYFQSRILEGADLWEELRDGMTIVLAHPNGWTIREQNFLRQAAIAAKYTTQAKGYTQIQFVNEAEASMHFCMLHSDIHSSLEPGTDLIVCDAGGSAINTTAYRVKSTSPVLRLEQVKASAYVQVGGVFVDLKCENHLKSVLSRIELDQEERNEYIQNGVDDFEVMTKRSFGSRELDGTLPMEYDVNMACRLRWPEHKIKRGIITLASGTVQGFFDGCVAEVVAVIRQQMLGFEPKHIVLVGGFGGSPYLGQKLLSEFDNVECTVVISHDLTSKAVADGAVIWSAKHIAVERAFGPHSSIEATSARTFFELPQSLYSNSIDLVVASRDQEREDPVLTWSAFIVGEKDKKTKGTLGVGNGTIFFVSESSETPVQRWQTSAVVTVTSPKLWKPKYINIRIASGSDVATLCFVVNSRDISEAITAKIWSSKAVASTFVPAATHSEKSPDAVAPNKGGDVRTTPPHESKRLDPTKPHPDRTRTWVDRTGQFKVEAEFLGLENDNIRLHKVNGAIITVPTAKMSPKDLAYVSAEVNKTPTTAQGNYGVPYPVMSKQSDSPILPKVQHLTLQPQPKKPSIDWFEFFLDVGCDLDDCTRYAATFDHDRIKEASLGDITAPQLRSLGLREGDVSRVMRAIGERGRGLGAIAKEQMGKGMTPSPWRSQSPSQLSQSQFQNLQINLFKLFLDAGCGPADSIDYAALFPQEQVDEATLESFTESTLRSLGLREDDILRVLKAIEKRGLHRRDGSARKERIREETDDSWALSPQSNLQITSPTSTAKNQPLALQAPPDSPAPRRAPTVAPITTPTTTSNTQRLTTITTAEASQLTPSDFNTLIKTNHRESQRKPSPPLTTKPNTPPATTINPEISSLMSATEIISVLTAHGCEDITSHLDLSSCSNYPLSGGGFGDVYRGKLNDGMQIAIKTMRIHLVSSEAGRKPLKDAARELHTWSKCRHSSVLKLLGVVQFRDQIGMVAEWMEHGNLTSYIMRRPTVNRCQLCISICDGLSYLHGIGIIHGDLKGLNVLVTNDGTAVLTDFGNAVLQERTLQFTATTAKSIMSPRWAAPELIEGTSACNMATDVYALGMTILETITGNVPYAEKSDHAVYLTVAVKKEPPTRPEDHIPTGSPHGDALWSLLTKCWAYDSKDRPTATNVWEIMRTITQDGLIPTS